MYLVRIFGATLVKKITFSVKSFPKLIIDVGIGYHLVFASESSFRSASFEFFSLVIVG